MFVFLFFIIIISGNKISKWSLKVIAQNNLINDSVLWSWSEIVAFQTIFYLK
jgi:hypothetical protein